MEDNQQMISDEQFYYGCDNFPQVAILEMPIPMEPDIHQEVVQNDPARWTLQEDARFTDALKMFGYGNWKMVANHVQTRNALQCQAYAHQSIQEPRLPSFSQVSSMASYPLSNETMRLPPASSMVPQVPISQNNHPPFFTSMDIQPVQPIQVQTSIQVPVQAPVQTPVEEPQPPLQEHIVCQDEITPDEKKMNSEWFLGKAAKTPERYQRIRNHILNCWKETRPAYLTKTAGRKNLSDCGDVNAVGRIHGYLESIGAINVNCVTVPVTRKRTVRKSSAEEGTSRKNKRPSYYWEEVYEQDDEDDKDHKPKSGSSTSRDPKTRPKRNARKREGFYGDNRVGYDSDPFTLIPLGYYTQTKDAPFTVEIGSDALLVMEFHAHLAYTEIIGLLGGRFLKNEQGENKLKVEYVFPCRSTSTGTQCEMDPVSEMAARELFEQKGLDVVGWYHSHPTFEPQPSIRDIENQTSYQDLFRNEASGDEPFIGFIISPYNQEFSNDRSQIQCLHISKKWSTTNQYRLPFACIQQVEQQSEVNKDVLGAFLDLLKEYKDHENKIDMTLPFGTRSRLDKLVSSLAVHIQPETNQEFLESVKQMVQQYFIQDIAQVATQPSDGIIHSLSV